MGTLWLKTVARPVPAVAREETRGFKERALSPHKTRRQLTQLQQKKITLQASQP